MTKLIVYFDESYVSDNIDNNYQKILFNSSSKIIDNKDIKNINVLIDKNSIEIRNIFWGLYNQDNIKNINKLFYSKKKWINKYVNLAIKSSRFNFGLSFDSDIPNFIKIISIAYWSKQIRVGEIKFYGFNSNWRKSFIALLDYLDGDSIVYFENSKNNNTYDQFNIEFFRGLGSILKYIYKFSKSLFFKPRSNNNQKVDYIFFDYYFNNKDILKSQYWHNLPETLSEKHKIELWHFFVPSSKKLSIYDAAKTIKKLNAQNNNIHHRLIDLELGFKDLIPALFKFIFISIYFLSKKFNSKFLPFILRDYRKSFFSGELLKFFLMHAYFMRSLRKDLSKTSIIYVGENQSWEKSLADVAVSRGCKNSIFSLQTSLRFWDMRFYYPSITETKLIKNNQKLYFPSIFACNSKYSFNEMSQRIPISSLKVVENLRFNINHNNITKPSKDINELNIFFIGEYLEKSTHEIFKIITNSIIEKNNYKIFFKAHPSDNTNFYEKNKKRLIKFDLNNDYFSDKNILIIGDGTSTFLLESFLRGHKVLAYLSKCSLNLSPFYKTPISPPFFSSVNELNDLVLNINKYNKQLDQKYIDEFIEPNINLNKWIRILNNS